MWLLSKLATFVSWLTCSLLKLFNPSFLRESSANNNNDTIIITALQCYAFYLCGREQIAYEKSHVFKFNFVVV